MARRKLYEILYPDGSKKHLDRFERDALVLAGLAKQVGVQRFRFIGQVKTYHSFRDYARAYAATPTLLRRFLPGFFIWEIADRRRRELLETPEAFGLRLSEAEP